MHFNLFDLSSLQIFPTIPQPFLVAATMFLALWVLVRWGSLLLLFYALTRGASATWGAGLLRSFARQVRLRSSADIRRQAEIRDGGNAGGFSGSAPQTASKQRHTLSRNN